MPGQLFYIHTVIRKYIPFPQGSGYKKLSVKSGYSIYDTTEESILTCEEGCFLRGSSLKSRLGGRFFITSFQRQYYNNTIVPGEKHTLLFGPFNVALWVICL